MNFRLVGLFFLLLALLTSAATAAEFSPAIDYELEKAGDKDFVSAIIILESPIDIRTLDLRLHDEGADLARRHVEVLDALQYNASTTQPKFKAEFDAAITAGEMEGYTAYWIENLFVVYATKEYLESFRVRGDVRYVCENFRAEQIEPIMGDEPQNNGGRNPLDTMTLPPGIQAVGAYRVNTELGITGQGVLVANCDTGVDGTHPALSSRWRGNHAPWYHCWMDNLGTGTTTPNDGNAHGTHVMGTITGRAIVGSDTQWVGCAPAAEWIANNAINQGVSPNFDNDIIATYQWYADPDSNSGTLDDVPDVIQNSWGVYTGLGYVQCFDFWNTVILNCEAAGPVITWSAGNESTSGLRSPAIYSINEYQIFAVAAVDASAYPTTPYPLASFSSQGPTPCTPASPNNIKPEISAPGFNVYSSVPGGGYNGTYSGTSMAGPHVAGVVALMREACPNCDYITIKQAIINTAIDVGYGPAGNDNQFGFGFIDGYSAVTSVSNLGRINGTVTNQSNGNPINGARVKNAAGVQQTFTIANGTYSLPLSAGTYSVEYSAFGFVTQTIPNLVVTTGNITTQNVALVPAPTGTVSGTVTSCLGGPAVGATVEVLGTPVTPATTNGAGFYSITLPQGTYNMRASLAGCGPHTVNSVVVGASATQNFTLPSDPIYSCATADAYGYVACENGDAGGPVYGWQEVAPAAGGPGTALAIVCDDCFGGPYNFPFPVQFYGTAYTQYYVGSNGYLTLGAGSSTYSNGCFPQNTMPAGIYAFWDDLYTSPASAQVASYYDAANHWLVVEWHDVSHCCSDGNHERYEIIIYDEAFYPTTTNDNNIVLQYDAMSVTGSATIGIKTASGVSNQYYCNGVGDANTQPFGSGRAVRFSTGGGCVGSPDIAVNPSSFNVNVPLGGTSTQTLQICNNGICPLTWSIAWNQTTPGAVADALAHEPGICELTKEQIEYIEAVNRGEKPVDLNEGRRGQDQLDAQGGPDSFGYTWIDSDEPGGPTFSWVDIKTVGTNIGLTLDDQTVNRTLPFTFSFYGSDYTSVNVSSNGNIHFGAAYSAFSNVALPSTAAPLAMIAPFWDDLYLPTSGRVYDYYDAPNNRYIVEWDSISHFAGTTDRYTFEAIIYNNGRIVLQYLTMTGGTTGVTSATIGIQNATGTVGLQTVFNAAYLHNNMAIQLQARYDWLTVTPPASGSLNPGQCTNVTLNFAAGTLPSGTYTGNLVIGNNDPDENPTNVPVTFNVGALISPTNLVVNYSRTLSQLRFDWNPTGAPLYRVYSSTASGGPFTTLVGQTASTTLSIATPVAQRAFYVVVATDGALMEAPPSMPGEVGMK